MQGFMECLCDFFGELMNNVFDEIAISNPTYMKYKQEKEQILVQLQNHYPKTLFDEYLETQYAIASFELRYCYLHGLRDVNKEDMTSPVSEELSHELYTYVKYKELQDKAQTMYSELLVAVSSENTKILLRFVELWNKILDTEKFYCYGGARHDRNMLMEYLDLSGKAAWENLTAHFL